MTTVVDNTYDYIWIALNSELAFTVYARKSTEAYLGSIRSDIGGIPLGQATSLDTAYALARVCIKEGGGKYTHGIRVSEAAVKEDEMQREEHEKANSIMRNHLQNPENDLDEFEQYMAFYG